MNRPEMLKACTVAEARNEIKENLNVLEYIGRMMANGLVGKMNPICESAVNQIMAEYVIQQEYLRDRELNNWEWDKKIIDFSKIV